MPSDSRSACARSCSWASLDHAPITCASSSRFGVMTVEPW